MSIISWTFEFFAGGSACALGQAELCFYQTYGHPFWSVLFLVAFVAAIASFIAYRKVRKKKDNARLGGLKILFIISLFLCITSGSYIAYRAVSYSTSSDGLEKSFRKCEEDFGKGSYICGSMEY